MDIGKVVKKLREDRKWNQDELAFRTDTSTANISRIETGKHGAGPELLAAIAKAFDYKVYQLIALAEGIEAPIIPINSNPEEELLLSTYRAMGSEQKKIFITVGQQFQKVTKN